MISDSSSPIGAVGTVLDRPVVRTAMLAVFAVVCLIVLSNGSPLGWDESVYAARAQDLLGSGFSWTHRSGTYWSDVRAPGLPLLLTVPFRVFGASDFVARAVVVACAVGFLAVMGRTLDLFFARRIGTTAVILAVTCPGFIATSTLAFADIPAVFFGTIAVYALAKTYVDDDMRLLVVVPIALGVATTIRFGAVLLVAAPLVCVGVLIVIRLVRRRDRRAFVIYAIAGLASVGVVTLLLTSRVLTTSASPVAATRAFHEAYGNPSGNWIDDLTTILRPGRVDYGFDGSFWGWSYAVCFGVLAVIAIVRLVVRRWFAMLALCGVIATTPILLYAVTVNQFVTTYLAPIFALGAAMVAVGLWFVDEPVPQHTHIPSDAIGSEMGAREQFAAGLGPAGRAASVIGAIAVVVLLALSAGGVYRMHDRLWGFDQLRQAAMIGDDLLGVDCKLATSRVPQVAWYSECYTARVLGADDLFGNGVDPPFGAQGERLGAESGEVVGLVLFDGLGGEPSIDELWDRRVVERSAILTSPAGRRVGVIALEVP